MEGKDYKRDPCNDCNMSWYRDFSAMFHGFKSVPVWLKSMSGIKAFKG
jgi:hypothetical protein